MKKMIKGLGLSLCALTLLAGCSCKKEEADTKANIKNPTDVMVNGLKENVESVTLQEVYDELKSTYGNQEAANKMLKVVSDLILSDQAWKDRYDAKVEEKMAQLENDSKYQIKGVFSEELLVKTLNSQMYNITCENNNYGPVYKQDGTIEKYRLCDYSNYIEKEVKLSVISQLINEKYIYDKIIDVDKKNILATKKARMVEYIAIDYSDIDTEEEVIAFIKENINLLDDDNSTLTLEGIANKWTDKKIEELNEEYAKIGTKDDKSGALLEDYTNTFTQDAVLGYEQRKEKIYDSSYYEKVFITSDSKSILNETLVERILSEDVISNSSKTKEINGNYYLVAPKAYDNITSSDIRIKDSANKKYYIVKVDVINNESDDALVYETVKVLATNTSLVSDSLEYFLEQYKNQINVYDEEIYTYLKTQYQDIFVD